MRSIQILVVCFILTLIEQVTTKRPTRFHYEASPHQNHNQIENDRPDNRFNPVRDTSNNQSGLNSNSKIANITSSALSSSSVVNAVNEANVPVVTTGQLVLNLTDIPKATIEPQNDNLNWSRLALSKIQDDIRRNLRLTPIAHPSPPHPPLPKPHRKYISNLEANNWISSYYFKHQWQYISDLNNSNVIRCSIQRPFFNGEECIKCNEYFNFDTKQCELGVVGKTFDPNIHQFVESKNGYKTDLEAPRLEFGGRTKDQIKSMLGQNQNAQLCPRQTPYYDGIICIQCHQPFAIFRIESRRCIRCLDTEQYSANSYGCYESGNKGDSWTLPKSLSNIFTSV